VTVKYQSPYGTINISKELAEALGDSPRVSTFHGSIFGPRQTEDSKKLEDAIDNLAAVAFEYQGNIPPDIFALFPANSPVLTSKGS
jgi:hypothetical protein